jgi:hypothetical protein
VFDAVLEKANGAQHINVRVEIRLPHRAPHVHLGGLVAERLGPELLEYARTPRTDIFLIEANAFPEVLSFARRKVVHHGDLVAALEKLFGYVGSNKSRTAGD